MRVGDAWRLGIRYCQEGGCGSQRELLRQAPYDWEEGNLLCCSRFRLVDRIDTNQVDWYVDFYFPFVRKWAERASRHTANGRHKFLFLEPIPNEVEVQVAIALKLADLRFQLCPSSWVPEHQPRNMVFSPHWYDLQALFNKAFGDFTVNVQGLSRVRLPLKTPPGYTNFIPTAHFLRGCFRGKPFTGVKAGPGRTTRNRSGTLSNPGISR